MPEGSLHPGLSVEGAGEAGEAAAPGLGYLPHNGNAYG